MSLFYEQDVWPKQTSRDSVFHLYKVIEMADLLVWSVWLRRSERCQGFDLGQVI